MEKGILTLLIGFALVVGLSVNGVSAADLPDDFDEPCPTGMSVLQATCVAVNANHDKADINVVNISTLNVTQIDILADVVQAESDIVILQTNVTIIESDIVVIEGDVSSLQTTQAVHTTEIAVLENSLLSTESRLVSLETESDFNTDLDIVASVDGAIKLPDDAILLFTDNLCKIDSGSAGSDVYIEFGSNVTVAHETNCESGQSGTLITLSSAADENFSRGDIIVFEQQFTNGFFWVEIFQSKN